MAIEGDVKLRVRRCFAVIFGCAAMSGCTLEQVEDIDFDALDECPNAASAKSVANGVADDVACALRAASGDCLRYDLKRSFEDGETETQEDYRNFSVIAPLNSGMCPAGYSCKTTDESGTFCAKSICKGLSVDIYKDDNNCGSCGHKCGTAESCKNGVCGGSDATKVWCDGKYIDPNTDVNYCGAKGSCSGTSVSAANYRGMNCSSHPSKKVCIDGSCVENCPSGQAICMHMCVTLADVNIAACEGLTVTCNPGFGQCDKSAPKCLDLSQDASNCGACGNKCGDGYVCVAGECAVNSCADDAQTVCSVGGENVCINVNDNNADHCGACNYKCADNPIANATSSACVAGKCQYACATGYTNVGTGATADTIKCADFKTDNSNCGAKGNVCQDGKVCVAGGCVQNSCSGGETLCSINGKNECKTISGTDANHCGTCNYDCAKNPITNATSSACVAGKCQYVCATGYTNVGTGATADTIKCADFKTDNNNCGAKGNVCKDGKVCVAGSCAQNSCTDANQTLCSSNGTNACININGTDANNCGTCNYKCSEHPLANAVSSSCAGGKCQYTCAAGYNNVGTGSSADTIKCADFKTDIDNCGSKGAKCYPDDGEMCVKGQCVTVSCPNASDTLCAGTAANYCININSDDADHCGACNYRCSDHPLANAASSSCADGVCQYACTGGTTNHGTGTTASTILCY